MSVLKNICDKHGESDGLFCQACFPRVPPSPKPKPYVWCHFNQHPEVGDEFFAKDADGNEIVLKRVK